MIRWHPVPVALYDWVERTPGTVLLDFALLDFAASSAAEVGVQPSESNPRTRIFSSPLKVCVVHHLDELPCLFAEIEKAISAGLYAAGYFAYECGIFFEPAAGSPACQTRHADIQPTAQPLAWFGIYERPYVFDHSTGTFDREPQGLGSWRTSNPEPDTESVCEASVDCTLALTEAEFAQQVAAIHEWIRKGDVYQLNLTWPIRVSVAGSSAALYRRLRQRQPAPYGAFLHTEPNRRILSFSPELFFSLQNDGEVRRILTRPMKGTAPRGRTTAEDLAITRWLQSDPKNRSENVMIVDLLRNDLGRLCAYGSVCASNLFAVEKYPSLWQMTSTVTGELRADVTLQQIFRALFPCGSITGAPKIRAMQLLAEIEAQPRGVYTGAIGFFSKEESILNVAIRTLALEGEPGRQIGTFGVGSGIVIDSDPADEFRECQLKAQFLTHLASDAGNQPLDSLSFPDRFSVPDRFSFPDSFSLVETLLWNGGYPFLDLHLDRLEDSAHYFGFPFNRGEVQSSLAVYAAGLANQEAAKVRLLLDPQGELSMHHELLSAPNLNPLRVSITSQRTDPQDPMYFHKTTHRPVYREALEAAILAGYDDVIFLNLHEEVTESAIHNVFVEKEGRLLTPPIHCGLLAGIYRRHVLATNPNAQERVLTIGDLRHADAIYLCNAVRGLRQAVIDWEAPNV